MSDRHAEIVREALDLGLQAWRATPVREKFHAAFDAAGELARLAADAERLREALRRIEDTSRWYADNDQRLQHEVDHALCVEVLSYALDALASPPADTEPWKCGWCGHENQHRGVICEKCSRYGQPPADTGQPR